MAFPSTDLDIIVEAFLGADPTADPDTWPAATDLSSRLIRRPIQIRRGRGNNQRTAQAGACTLWLDNTDGALTPLLATSPYYLRWDLGVPFRVSVDNVGDFPPYVRHAGFVAEIKAVMIPGVGGLNISAVQVTSAGVLRRLSQGTVLKSTLRRMYLSSAQPTPVAYWPCEDSEGATSIASGLPSGVPLVGETPHFTTGIDGSSGAVDLSQILTTDGLGADVALPDANGFQIEVTALADTGADTTILRVISGTMGIVVMVLLAAQADGLPHHRATRFEPSGADVSLKIYVDGVLTTTSTLPACALSNSVNLNLAAFEEIETSIAAHIAVYDSTSMNDPATRALAADGFAGEQAHDRIERLCGEEGIPYSGTATESNECGIQPVGELIAVLQDAETVDHGMLIEDFAFGLNYRASSQRYNLDPVLTVDLSTYRTTVGTQADVLAPVRNDARVRNEWTISRPSGSSATASDTTNIAARGRFKDSAEVNVADDTRLIEEASWRVHEGTFGGLRYDVVPLDIAANL